MICKQKESGLLKKGKAEEVEKYKDPERKSKHSGSH